MSAGVTNPESEVERAKLDTFRERFTVQTADWLRGWYRQGAYGYAANNVPNSLVLGGEGLREFRLEVDALIEQADQIAACFLHDEVWWHVDPYMDRNVVVYSVRLCMGQLRGPLQRFGFLQTNEWREAQKLSVRRPNQRGDAVEWEDEIEFHPVATNRPFFRCDDKDKRLPEWEWSTEGWSAPMLGTLQEYFTTVERIQAMERAESKQQEALAAQERVQAVKAALEFAALSGEKDRFAVPRTALNDVLRAQRR
ncbi:MAG: hypothetical protein INR62_03375 [Rhodospirillales bacterium]|nr:hypothetical protein [Acetobacter sp.]